jgi:hypothetical protein
MLLTSRYILTFDSDRTSLAAAYTEDAIFSFRDTNFAQPSHFTFQRTRPSLVNSSSSSSPLLYSSDLRHPESTMPKLPALAGFRFSPAGGSIDLDYDTVVLDPPPARVLLSVHGQLIGPGARALGIDQSFVLQRSASDAEYVTLSTPHVNRSSNMCTDGRSWRALTRWSCGTHRGCTGRVPWRGWHPARIEHV